MDSTKLPGELRDLIERIAARERRPSSGGSVAIAVTYRVHPFVVFHARELVRHRRTAGGEGSGGRGGSRS